MAETNLKLVLIADRLCLPLAYYWQNKSPHNSIIIDVNNSFYSIEKKINLALISDNKQIKKCRCILNDIEVKVLDLLVSGFVIKDIALALSINLKKAYNIKSSLQNKMGGKGVINKIISAS
ncbi:hypothetical protein [Klebsiella aerogenes]|uniref:hypothetical protein n=1 Tax=Klebsiella aerogenes TaxID=548 RepID=UPI0032DB8BBB